MASRERSERSHREALKRPLPEPDQPEEDDEGSKLSQDTQYDEQSTRLSSRTSSRRAAKRVKTSMEAVDNSSDDKEEEGEEEGDDEREDEEGLDDAALKTNKKRSVSRRSNTSRSRRRSQASKRRRTNRDEDASQNEEDIEPEEVDVPKESEETVEDKNRRPQSRARSRPLSGSRMSNSVELKEESKQLVNPNGNGRASSRRAGSSRSSRARSSKRKEDEDDREEDFDEAENENANEGYGEEQEPIDQDAEQEGEAEEEEEEEEDEEEDEEKEAPVETFLYRPGVPLPNLAPYVHKLIEVRIAAEYLSMDNKFFQKRHIWGNDLYTSDSDLVCVLHHTGLYKVSPSAPKEIDGLAIFLRVSKGRTSYTSTTRQGLRTRRWNNYEGHSIKAERCEELMTLGSKEEMDAMMRKMPSSSAKSKKSRHHQMRRFIPDVTLMFNLSNEPCMKYTLGLVADKGLEHDLWTSFRLKKDVIYLETDQHRFELSLERGHDGSYDSYRWARVLNPYQMNNSVMSQQVIPLNPKLVDVVFDRLDWEDIEWGPNSIRVKGQLFPGIVRAQFLSIKSEEDLAANHQLNLDVEQKDSLVLGESKVILGA